MEENKEYTLEITPVDRDIQIRPYHITDFYRENKIEFIPNAKASTIHGKDRGEKTCYTMEYGSKK